MTSPRAAGRLRLLAAVSTVAVLGALVPASAASLGGVVSAQVLATASTASPPFTTVVMADNFTSTGTMSGRRPQSVGTGTWVQANGSWATANGVVDPPGSSNALVLYNAAATDVRIEASITINGNARIGLALRANATGSAYLNVTITNSGQVLVEKMVSGVRTTLITSSASVPSGSFRWLAQIAGSVVTVALNGTPVTSYTLSAGDQSTFGALTSVGLSATGSTNEAFDDVVLST